MKQYKDILKLFVSFMIFFFTSFICVLFIKYVLNIDLSNIDEKGLAIFQLFLSLFFVVAYSIMYFDIIKNSVINIRKNGKIKQFITAIVIGFAALYGAQIVAGIIEGILYTLTGVEKNIVENQQVINKLLESAPVIMIISACILGPIEEELLFRGAVSKVLKNKKVFITVSGLIFGLVHVTDSVLLVGEFILLGVVIDSFINRTDINKKGKITLSVMSTVSILLIFGGFYYFEYGNLISVITNLDMVEVIGGISYVLVGIVLSSLYIHNDKNILINMGIHACSNTFAVLMTLCLK